MLRNCKVFVSLWNKQTPMKHHKILLNLIVVIFILIQENELFGQNTNPKFVSKAGIGIVMPDSLFSINFRFRIQSRAGVTFKEGEDTPEEVDFRIRRIRLRLDGFMLDPRLTYQIQLSFSRADMDWDNSNVPNVLRDAMIHYAATPNWTISMGQGKLPGNRQRVISSSELQFADRSIVNNALTLDRDVGLFTNLKIPIKKTVLLLKAALTSGEGRNALPSKDGVAYTGRVEFLPLGAFTDRGDYFEGDLLREPKPKISIAFGANLNEGAIRTGGTLGQFLYQPRSFTGINSDFLFKYIGWAYCLEYMNRIMVNNQTPFTTFVDGSKTLTRYVYAGEGLHQQLSYCTTKAWEFAVRYSTLTPANSIHPNEKNITQIGFGFSKYLRKHRVKIQSDIFYDQQTSIVNEQTNRFGCRFQMELGI